MFLSGNADKEFAFNMTNGDVWGKVAVDGSVFARSFGFGTRLTCSGDAANQATLIAYVSTTYFFVSTESELTNYLHSSGSTVDVTGEIQCGNLVTPASTTVTGVSFRNGQAITGDITSITGTITATPPSAISVRPTHLFLTRRRQLWCH